MQSSGCKERHLEVEKQTEKGWDTLSLLIHYICTRRRGGGHFPRRQKEGCEEFSL